MLISFAKAQLAQLALYVEFRFTLILHISINSRYEMEYETKTKSSSLVISLVGVMGNKKLCSGKIGGVTQFFSR